MIIGHRETEKTARLLAFMLNWNAFTGMIESMSKLPGLAFLSAFSKITVLFSFLFVFLSILYTVTNIENVKLFAVMVGWVALFAVSCFLNPGISVIASRAFIYFANNVFCIAILLQATTDLQSYVDALKKYIPVTIIYSILQWVVGSNEVYSMSFSYSTMISMLLCLLLFIRKEKGSLKYLASFIFIVVTNFVYGSRGGFLCCALVVVLNFFLSTKRKKAEYLMIALFGIITISLCWDYLVLILARFFPKSRNVIVLLQGKVFYWARRDIVYSKVIEEFLKNPFAIRGLYSDRLLLSNSLQEKELLWGSYTHNIVLEVLYQWGVWSVPVILIFGIYVVKVFVMAKHADEGVKVALLIAYAFSLGQLMVSSSYLISPSFGLLLGILLWSRRYQHKERRRTILLV